MYSSQPGLNSKVAGVIDNQKTFKIKISVSSCNQTNQVHTSLDEWCVKFRWCHENNDCLLFDKCD